MGELQQLLDRFLTERVDSPELEDDFALLLDSVPGLASVSSDWLVSIQQQGAAPQGVYDALHRVLADKLDVSGDATRPTATEQATRVSPQQATRVNDPSATRPSADQTNVVDDETTRPGNAVTQSPRNAAARLGVGSVIGGRYELLAVLGSGGMGHVFKARDRLRVEADDRHPDVAIKIIGDEFRDHPDSMIALQREARRSQTLAHPNVITVHDFFRDGPHFYMTMELLEGKALDQVLESDNQHGMPFDKAWPIIRDIGVALQYGHDKGIVHSDIKPANVFVCDDGTIKVLDLGISRPMKTVDSERTRFDPGERLGGLTPAFASLEMWHRAQPHPSDDIYGLACISYMLLTGRHPFRFESAVDASREKMKPAPVNGLARGQWRALGKGLAFRREDRFDSIDIFLKRLSPEHVSSSRRRLAWVITAAVIAGISAIGVWYYGLLVERDALSFRNGLTGGPVERPVLTAEQAVEIENLVELAGYDLSSITADASTDELIGVLSSGPNSVVPLLNTALEIDPGYPPALEKKQQAFEMYLQRARDMVDDRDYIQAMRLVRSANSVVPNSAAVLRLQRTICRRDPAACE